MFKEKGTIKNILIGAAVLGGLFVAYTFFFKSDSPPSDVLVPLGGSTTPAPESAVALLRILGDLRKIHLDTSLFGDEAYRTLRDFSVLLVPEPRGRPNPFAPLQ